MRIGIISDTHGLLRPEAVERLAGVDHIIHAGDIGRADVISGLREIAPVTAVRGNIDRDEWAAGYPQTEFVKLAGRFFYVLHNLAELDLDPVGGRHRRGRLGPFASAQVETVDGVIYLNPGKCGATPLQPAHRPRDARSLRQGDSTVHRQFERIGATTMKSMPPLPPLQEAEANARFHCPTLSKLRAVCNAFLSHFRLPGRWRRLDIQSVQAGLSCSLSGWALE